MLNAAEASMDQAAEDDAERQRNRTKLYAPPAGLRRGQAKRVRPPGMAMDQAQVRSMMAQVAAEDARYTGKRRG